MAGPRAVLDACVLYPTVMRQMLLGVAAAGLYRPLWSARLAEEWARAAARHGPDQEAQARGEIAMLAVAHPDAVQAPAPGIEARLWLPDPGDLHVLAVAIASSADVIVTMNARDFPRNILAEEGLSRADPDAFLLGFWQASPGAVNAVGARVLADANRMAGGGWDIRALLKKARLPRLAKALSQAPGQV